LKSRGIDSALLSELEEMGPAAAGEIAALNQLSSTELDKYVSLWQEKNKLAKDQAISELEGLKTETATKIQELTTQANKDLSNYNKEYKKAMKELGVSIKEPITVLKASAVSDGEEIVTKITKSIKKNASSKETKDNVNTLNTKVTSELSKMAIDAVGIGANVVSGVISGMNSKTSELTKAASDMVTAALKSAKKTGKINSPSQLFRDEVGKYLAQGIGVGFSDEMSKISLDMSKSIPTDYEVNGANNITGSQITENSNLYNAFAAVATDILVPVLMKIGANFNVQTDKNGIVKIIRDESIDYYNRTGKGLFPA
jgi:hypothetical protein